MSAQTRIRIDRVAVRVRGVPVETARAAAAGLGMDLATRLAAAGLDSTALGNLQLGRVEARRGATPAELRTTMADRATSAVVRLAKGEVG